MKLNKLKFWKNPSSKANQQEGLNKDEPTTIVTVSPPVQPKPAPSRPTSASPRSKDGVFYTGLIVTSIKVATSDSDPTQVSFKDTDPNSDSGAVFLKDVKQTNDIDEDGKREFSATLVSLDEAKEIASAGYGSGTTSTPLFILHGFNVEPDEGLRYDYARFVANKQYFPIPVIWATRGKTLGYFGEQKDEALDAGRALQALVDSIPNNAFPRKSALLHSMGNHAVFNSACKDNTPDVQFENIFMCAADLPYDIFHKDPHEYYWTKDSRTTFGNKRGKADNFFGMLAKDEDGKPKGKIYVMWNNNDTALQASNWGNWENRLGKVGADWVDGWFWFNSKDDSVIRDEFRPYIENLDCTKKDMKDDNKYDHSYQLEPWAIDFYEEKSVFDVIALD